MDNDYGVIARVGGTACSGPTRTIEEVHFSDYVNPFIGASTNTEAAGATMAWEDLPRCDYPFRYGMVSPNTITGATMVPDIATSMRRSRDSPLRR